MCINDHFSRADIYTHIYTLCNANTDMDNDMTRTWRYVKSLKCRICGHEFIYYIIMNYTN